MRKSQRATPGDGTPSKSTPVAMRLSAPAYSKFTEQVELSGLSQRAWFEQAVLENKTEIIAKRKPHPELRALLFHVNKTGNNINQLAHHFNRLRLEGKLSEAQAVRALDLLAKIESNFSEALSAATN